MATSKVSIPKYISTKHATHFKNAFPGDGPIFHMTEITWPVALYFTRQWRCTQRAFWALPLPATLAITETRTNPSLPGIIIHHSISFPLPLLPGRSNVKFNKLNKSYFSLCLYGSWQGALQSAFDYQELCNTKPLPNSCWHQNKFKKFFSSQHFILLHTAVRSFYAS